MKKLSRRVQLVTAIIAGLLMSSIAITAYAASPGVGSWNTTTALPTTTYASSSVTYNGYVYELGGNNSSNIINGVYYAPLNANGTVGAWSTTTALPDAMDGSTSIVNNGYVYEIGGQDVSNNSLQVVYYAPLNANGTVGAWSTTTALPSSLGIATSVVYNGYVYELGGQLTNNTYVNTVYYAPLSSNGTVGTWSTTTALPTNLGYATSVVYNGFVYEIGGQLTSGGTIVSTVYDASITGYPLPGLNNQTTSVASGSSVTVNVLNNVNGNPDPATLSIVSGPHHGTAVDPPGTITYTPTKGYVGSDSLVFQVCSLSNSGVCSQATLSFNVVAGAPNTGFGISASVKPWETLAVYGTAAFGLVNVGFGLRKLSKNTSDRPGL